MRLEDVLRFRNPSRINWKATEEAIRDALKAEYPGATDTDRLIMLADRLRWARKEVRKEGVKLMYEIDQLIKREKEGQNGN